MSDSHEIEIQPDNHGIEDRVFSKIKADLSSSSPSTKQPEICKIRRVQPHDRPREKTMSAYKPKIISIGPLHHGKPELQRMEVLKHEYLNKLLNRRGQERNYEFSSDDKNDELLGKFIAEAKNMEEEVRCHYDLSDINTISSDDFVRMLVIDGCFLLEFLFHSNTEKEWFRKSYDDDLGLHGRLIYHDILLFENQIPFFVLQKFYKILTEYCVGIMSIEKVANDCMEKNHFIYKLRFWPGLSLDPSNLLHLYYIKPVDPYSMQMSSIKRRPCPFCFFYWSRFWSWFCSFFRNWMMLVTRWMVSVFFSYVYFIRKIFFAPYPIKLFIKGSATDIEEAGVGLQGSLMDLRFKNGTLTIPVLILNQENLCLLKNLMVFEFYFRRDRVPPYVHAYVSFLAILIRNPGDLKVMEKHGIIITRGDGDGSFALVNELIQARFEGLMAGEDEADLKWQGWFSIIYDIQAYCSVPHHRWRAMLMKDYFGSPWSIIGLLAGVFLLSFTGIQTLFTVLSYDHQ